MAQREKSSGYSAVASPKRTTAQNDYQNQSAKGNGIDPGPPVLGHGVTMMHGKGRNSAKQASRVGYHRAD